MGGIWHRWRRWIALVVGVASFAGGLAPVAAAPPPEGDGASRRVDWWDDLSPSTADDDPEAPPVEPVQSAAPIEDEPFEPSASARTLPASGVAEVTLGSVGESRRAGAAPIELAPESRSASGESVQVEVLDHAVASRMGVTGFAFQLRGEDGAVLDSAAGSLPVSLSVDYSGFKDLYGAGYADRLRVVALPECAFADPVPEGCEAAGRPLPMRNDRAGRRLVVEVPDLAAVQGAPVAATEQATPGAPESPAGEGGSTTSTPTREGNESATTPSPSAASPAAEPLPQAETGAAPAQAEPEGGATVLAVTSGPEGERGSFKATPFALSGDWQVAVGSGEFSWNYDFVVPEAPVGATPGLSLGYSSGSVDAMVTSRNSQAGQAGLGWGDFAGSFIERRYASCRFDFLGDGTAGVDDLCWMWDNASISLNGQVSELVAVPNTSPKQWRLKVDPRWRVEQLTGANNSDNDGEHWKVTTPDGIQYWFGSEQDSAWVVPVIGDDTGDPCNTPQGGDLNICHQAWRWALEKVEDPNGNVTRYGYVLEENRYAGFNGWPGLTQWYHRAGKLFTIEYGLRAGSTAEPAAQVEIEAAWRCADMDGCPKPTRDTEVSFPDVPLDLLCAEGETCSVTSPTFFSARRYTRVDTRVNADGTWLDVDSYALTHAFSDPEPGTDEDAKLYLIAIQRTGHSSADGSTVILPATVFWPVSLNNRFNPPAGESAMPQWRVGAVIDEFGRTVIVTYGQPHPCPRSAYPNSRDCFQQQWTPPGAEDPVFVEFNKYLVTQVEVKDGTGGSPPMVTSYAYGNQVGAGLPNAEWHWDNDPYIPQSDQGWNTWRGYSDVTVTQGSTKTRYRVFRGMNGDEAKQIEPDGYRDVNISSIDGSVVNIPDDNWLAGRILEEQSLRADGTVERGTVHRYQSIRTVDAPDGPVADQGDLVEDANFVGENDTVERRRTPAAGQVFVKRRSETTYNGFLQFPEQVREHGWTDQTGDERCTKTSYVFDVNKWMLDFPATATRHGNTTCSGTEVTRTETAYDGGAVGAAPTKGNLTTSRTKIDTSTWATTTATFDAMGRPAQVTDPNARTTSTAYSHPTGYPHWVEVTNHLGHVQRTELTDTASGCPACVTLGRQLPVAMVDANGKRTSYTYDPLGRVSTVRQPTEQSAGAPASWEFVYDIDPGKSEVPVIRTRQLQDQAGAGASARYLDTWILYDSLLRERQAQTLSPVGGRVLVADTAYDNRGLVAQTNLPQALTGTAGNTILPAPSGGWANRTVTTNDTVSRPTRVDFYTGGSVARTTSSLYTHLSVEVTPPQGGKTLTVTDAYDRIVRVEEHDGTAYRPTVYTYDVADRLATVTDPASNRITYTYDMAGRRLNMQDPDAGSWSYGYDAAGNQTRVTDASGVATHTIYDALHRPIERRKDSVTGALLASWAYDAPGEKGLLNRSTRAATGGNWVVDVTGYDGRNRPTGRTWTVPAGIAGLSGSYTVSYGYDAADHQRQVTYPTVGGLGVETVTTNYNSIGLPETMAGAESYVHAAGYDDRARPVLFGFGSGTAQPFGKFWEYNTSQQLLHFEAAAKGTEVQDVVMAYDQAGNVTDRNSALGGQTYRECFGYDQRQRLTSAYTTAPATTCASGSNKGQGAQPYNHTYTYTTDGNLKTRVESGNTTTYTYPPGGATSVRPHAPTAVGSNGYTWNANGNLATRNIAGQTETFAWDAEHNLVSIDHPDGDSAYVYDANGRRLLRETPQGKTLYIEGHEITAPTTGSTTGVRSYAFGGELIATRNPTGVDYLASDNQSSVQVSVPSGTTTATVRSYQPYGKPRHTGQHDTDKAWIGQVEDDTTGLSYLNARYYDPTIGVFTAPDPIYDQERPKSLNAFAYALNNPTTHEDPGGDLPPECASGAMSCSHGTDPNSGWNVKPHAPTTTDVGLAGEYEKNRDNPGFWQDVAVEIDSCLAHGLGDISCNYLDLAGANSVGDYYPALVQLVAQQMINQAISAGTIVPTGYGTYMLADCAPVCMGAFEPAGPVLTDTPNYMLDFLVAESMTGFAPSSPGLGRMLGLCSFDAETRVLMANGELKPIVDVREGDMVLATNPETGETGAREVLATMPHTDQLLTMRTSSGDVVTTEDHKYWNATDQVWQESQHLDPGDRLLAADGDKVLVEGLDWTTLHTAPAYDLTIDDLHTFYVAAGDEAVLVHNCSVAQTAAGLRARAGSNRVSIETPNGRLSIDLEGKPHFEKTLGSTVDTPHVKFETKHIGPNGQVSYTSGPVRPATHDDLRLVERVLRERGL